MTSFSVRPAAVRELAHLVGRAREDVAASQQHLTKMQDFAGGEGVIGKLSGGHRDAYQALHDWLGRLADPTLASVRQAIDDAATYYERTDQASAEKLDGSYPAADATGQRRQTGSINAEGTPAEFQDVLEPRGRLNEPKDYRDEMRGDYDWWDVFSPMTAIGAALEAVSHVAYWLGALPGPVNPWDEIVKPWVGDWAGLRAAADVLNNVGWAVNDVGINIQWGSQGSQVVWQGNAGDGAAVYLMNLVKPFEGAHTEIDKLAERYRVASEEMVKMREAVVNVLKSVGDAAIQAAVAASVAGGSASTGVGLPIAILAGAFSGHSIYRVVDGIKQIFEIIGKFDEVIKGVEAAQTNFGSLHHADVKLPTLPNSALDAPR
jgi:uncharacterized protein YukE